MPIKIHDLIGLSKPLTRLIEVISQGVGAVSRPYLIRKNADAKAYEIHTIAAALSSVADQHHLPVIFKDGEIDVWQKPDDGTLVLGHTTSEERRNRRNEYESRKRQHNLESITSAAAEELAGESEVSDTPPDEDWVSRFFRSAEDVSSGEMQKLWGKILAGEIKRSGSYSLKTLDLVKDLTKSDAAMFETLAGLAVFVQGVAVLPRPNRQWLESERKVYYMHHYAAGELGAMYPIDLTYHAFVTLDVKEEVFTSGKRVLVIDRNEVTSEIELPIWKFTGIGKELLQLIPIDGDFDHLAEIARFFVTRKAKARIGEIVERLPDGKIRCDNVRDAG